MGSQEYNLAVLGQIVKHIPGKLIEKRKRLVIRMSEAGLNRQKQKSIILSDRQQHCRAIDSAGENPVETWGYREVGS